MSGSGSGTSGPIFNLIKQVQLTVLVGSLETDLGSVTSASSGWGFAMGDMPVSYPGGGSTNLLLTDAPITSLEGALEALGTLVNIIFWFMALVCVVVTVTMLALCLSGKTSSPRFKAVRTVSLYLLILLASCSHVGVFQQSVKILVTPGVSLSVASIAALCLCVFGVGWLVFVARQIYSIPESWYRHDSLEPEIMESKRIEYRTVFDRFTDTDSSGLVKVEFEMVLDFIR